MSTEEKKESKVVPFERKSCYDCAHLKSAVHWWCTKQEAIEARGTSLPGTILCPFWVPEWDMIKDEFKTIKNGYVKPLTWYQKFINFFK